MADDPLLSQIASDAHDTKQRVEEMHRMLFIEGPAGKPSLHERVAALESKSKIASWVGSTIAGGFLLGFVALFFSFFSNGDNQ